MTLFLQSFLGFAIIFVLLLRIYKFIDHYYLSHYKINAPVVGQPPGIFGRFRAPHLWMDNGLSMVHEGMALHGQYGRPFKAQSTTRWHLFLTSPEMIEELQSLPSWIASAGAAFDEQLCTDYTFYSGMINERIHLPLIRENLTKNSMRLLPQLIEEINLGLEAYMPSMGPGLDWTSVDVMKVMGKILGQATNRIFVGTPLNRDEIYQAALVNFAENLVGSANMLDNTPWILRPLVARFCTTQKVDLRIITSFVGPIFEERRRKRVLLGLDYPDKKHDTIQWIVDANALGRPIDELIKQLLFIAAAAIHTTRYTMAQFVYDLAYYPQYQAPLRQEVKSVLAAHAGNWNNEAFAEVKLLDSFFRESGRLNGVDLITTRRRIMTPYYFSSSHPWVYVHEGTWVSVPSAGLNLSERNYENPREFDGFRFARMREQKGSESMHQYVQTSNKYLTWGHGATACPGRFFAAAEMKVLAAKILLRYDIKFPDEVKERPNNTSSGISIIPAHAMVLFRNYEHTD